MDFLGGLFERKANNSKSSADSIARATGASAGNSFGQAQPLGPVGQWDAEVALQAGYERVIWIFRCVDVISQNQASRTIRIRKGIDRRFGAEVENDRLFRLLNFRANSYESSWQFRYRLSSQLLLSRRGAFVEIVRGRDGIPSELHLLPVGKTKPIPDVAKFVSGYEITRADNNIDILPPESVIWLRVKPHPVDPYAQMTPLVVAGIEADTDFLARLFNRNFLANDGGVARLITIDPGEANLPPGDAEVIKNRFSGGPVRAGSTTVIEAAGIDVVDLSANPKDVQWNELLTLSKERILMAFGVPESVMGNAANRTFDNADAERENFWMDTEIPHCDNIAFSLDVLTDSITDDTVCAFDYGDVDVLQRAAANRRQEWRDEVAAGLRTIDEYLDASNRETWGVGRTEVFYRPDGVTIAKNENKQQEADKYVPPKTPGMEDPNAMGAAPFNPQRALDRATAKWGNEITARLYARKSIEQKSGPIKVARRQKRTKSPAHTGTVEVKDEHDRELESFIDGVLASWDLRQEKVLVSRLDHVKVRKGTRHWDGEFTGELKALDPNYVVDAAQWKNELLATVEESIYKSVDKAGREVLRQMREDGTLDELVAAGTAARSGDIFTRLYGTNAGYQRQLIVEQAMSVVSQAAENNANRIAQRIAKMDADGESLTNIKKTVGQMIGQRSRWRKLLANNVATQVREATHESLWGASGARNTVTWHTAHDERVRASHRRLDGSERPSTGFWMTETGPIHFPGDPTAPLDQTVNCRCWTTRSSL